MSDDTSEKDYTLPHVDYPGLVMPPDPVVPGMPNDLIHKSCDGEDYAQPDFEHSTVSTPTKKRLLIGIPILSYSHEFIQSFLKFIVELYGDQDKDYEVGYHFVYRKPIQMADQLIVDMALYNKCTHILFIDDDITDYTKAMLDVLFKADKDIISGIMYASKFPFSMCAFRRYDTTRKVIDMPSDNTIYRLYEIPCQCANCHAPMTAWGCYYCGACGVKQDNLIQKVDLIPFPFTLIKTEIFKKLKQPWFHCTVKYPADSWFADRCIEAGVQQYAHMGVRLTHAGINDLTKGGHFSIGLEIKKRIGSGVVYVTEEEMNRHQYMLNEKMHEAEEKLKAKESPTFTNVETVEAK
jgi:hypothetical protein